MAMISQQKETTFPIWDGELVLWQPEEATYRESRDNDGPGPTGPLVRFYIPPETCPWTEQMVQELWTGILQENGARISPVMSELRELEEFHDLLDAFSMDITGHSYFTEWDQSIGFAPVIRNAMGNAQKFTPEMLEQRDHLNDMFQGGWSAEGSDPRGLGPPPGLYSEHEDLDPFFGEIIYMGGQIFSWLSDAIESMECDLELLSVGDGHGIAKCEYGTVFVPKSSLKHLGNLKEMNSEGQDCGVAGVGQKFKSWISFTNGKYPWRIEHSVGVTDIY
jgi:hypothetical protein